MAGLNFKMTFAGGETIDLTSATVNPDAAPTATPREGGFVLRNRWNCDNLSAANKQTFGPFGAGVTASATSANVIRIMKVPKRTILRGPVNVVAVASETIPGHGMLGAATKASLDAAFTAGVLGFTVQAFNDNSQTAASIKTHTAATWGGTSTNPGCVLGGIPIQLADSLNGAFEASMVEKVDTSMTTPWLGMVNRTGGGAIGTGGGVYPGADMYLPYGGYVAMILGPYNVALGAMASSKGAAEAKGLYGYLTGTWDVSIPATYVPE